MADEPVPTDDADPDAEAGADAAAAPGPPVLPAPPVSWSQLWQVPVLLLGLGLFAVGLWAVRPVAVESDLDAVLDDADRLLVAAGVEEVAEAGEQLERVFDAFADQPVTDEQRGRYWQYAGDRVYLQQARGGAADGEAGTLNHGLVLEQYRKAEDLGRELDARSLRWRALTLVDLGRTEDALAAVEDMGADAGRERLGVLKEMIRRRQDAAGSAAEEAEDPVLAALLERYRERVAALRDPADRAEERRWLTATRARRMLATGSYARAADFLSREVMQLRSASAAGTDAEPELTLLLADAHRGLGDLPLASRLYRQAQRSLPEADPLAGDALLGLAAVAEAEAAAVRTPDRVGLTPEEEEPLARAAGLYAQTIAGFPGGRQALEARLGAARVATFRDPPAETLAAWRTAVAALAEETGPADRRRDAAAADLSAATDRALDAGRYDDALDLLSATTPLFGRGVPASLLLRRAQTQESLAEQRMAEGADATGPARAQLFREAAAGFAAAGAAFDEHARRLARLIRRLQRSRSGNPPGPTTGPNAGTARSPTTTSTWAALPTEPP